MKLRALALTMMLGLAVLSVGGAVGPDVAAAGNAGNVDASSLSGSGTSDDPYVVTNVSELQAMEDDPDASYELGNDIDASATSAWNDGDGFDPVGNTSTQFTGTFDGAEYSITNLSINRSSADGVGLFGVVDGATVSNVTLDDVNVSGGAETGALAGNLTGTVENVHVSGVVDGGTDGYIGGLVGKLNDSTVTDGSAAASVSGKNRVGGLVGEANDAGGSTENTITDSYATGDVTGATGEVGGLVGDAEKISISGSYATGDTSGYEEVGGLVGRSGASINSVIDSYATGDVTTEADEAGGLVGSNDGTLFDSYATGDVTGGDIGETGGLVGRNFGVVTRVHASGDVTGRGEDVGGLVGNNDGGRIEFAYATGDVTAATQSENYGGLVGQNGNRYDSNVVIRNSYATGNVTGNFVTNAGGLVGTNEFTIENSYAVGTVTGLEQTGGLVGSDNGGTVTNGYWNVETSGQDSSAGGTGLVTARMTGGSAETTMAGLDFTETWTTVNRTAVATDREVSYPYLFSNNPDPKPGLQTVTDESDFAVTIDDADAYVRPGETLAVNTTVTNLGILSDTQNVQLTIDGTSVSSQSLALSSGETTTANFTYATESGDTPSVTAAVESDDDAPSRDIVVTDATGPSCGDVNYDGSGTSTNPYQIGTVAELQCLQNQGLDAHYVLVGDIDAAETVAWNSESGFDPVGSDAATFNGTLDGDGYTVTDLAVNRSSENDIGLFGVVGSDGTVSNLTLADADVSGNLRTGALAGTLNGSAEDIHATGTVTSGDDSAGGVIGIAGGATIANTSAAVTVDGGNDDAGGLVGVAVSGTTITESHATGSVTSQDDAGGLVGYGTDVEITQSDATGDVAVDSFGDVAGGLVGRLDGDSTLRDSYATGEVTVDDDTAGGLVGSNDGGDIVTAYATGDVTADGSRVGGLVGENVNGDILDSYATGEVESVLGETGGLVGDNDGNITSSHATGDVVSGDSGTGGLVGYNPGGNIEFSYATGDVTGAGFETGGLIGENDGTLVRYAFATGDVEAVDDELGGLVGTNDGPLENVYATGNVSGLGQETDNVGGLVGNNFGFEVSQGYASGTVSGTDQVGGLVGNKYGGTLVDSYWDELATNQSAAVGNASPDSGVSGFATDDGQGRADEMTGSDATSNMPALDFDGQWTTRTDDYPTLRYATGNGPPIASGDSYDSDGTLSVATPGVLGNDTDPDADDLSVTGVVSQPSHGNLALNADGSFEYTPDLGFDGDDSFVYEVSDGTDTDTATVTVDVTNPRVAIDDITVEPGDPERGELVTIAANVTNPSDSSADKTLTTTIDGTPLTTQSLTLAGGETRRVTIERRLFKPGDRSISFPETEKSVPVTVERNVTDPDWDSWHLSPEHRNYDPAFSGPRQPLSEAWTVPFPDSGTSNPVRPLVVNDTLFSATYLSTYAIDVETGSLQWSNTSVQGTYLGGLAHEDGRLFVSTYNTGLTALDRETGQGLWTREDIDATSTAPAVSNGTVFVGDESSSLWALDAETGDTKWEVTYADATYPSDFAAPTAVDGQVYVSLPNGTLMAHDAETGDTLWKKDIGYTEATPAVKNGTVFITDSGSAPYLHALDAETGEEVWNATSELGYTGVSVTEDMVYVATFGDSVFAYDLDTGEREWARTGTAGAYDISEPVTVGKYVYTTDYNAETRALDRYTGETMFTIDNPSGCKYTSPTPYRGVLYFADRYCSGGVTAYAGPERPTLNATDDFVGEETTLTVRKEYRDENVSNATLTIAETGDTLETGTDGVASYEFPGTGTYQVTISADNTTLNNYVETTRDVTIGNRFADGNGTTSDPFQIANWTHLDNVRYRPGANYTLVSDLNETTAGYDAVASANANEDAGFVPIGDSSDGFVGSLDGTDHTISGLTVNRSDENDVGLFGVVGDDGTVEALSLAEANVTGDSTVGTLAGSNSGTITNATADGDLTSDGSEAGGLVGRNQGTLERTGATVTVTGGDTAGGLVGRNEETLNSSYATGNVSGSSTVGGLVGENGGEPAGTIRNSYATGNVSGGETLGGLAGTNAGDLRNAYWDTNTTGQSEAVAFGFGTTTNVAGLTTAEMSGVAALDNMSALDTPGTWYLTDSYPALSWEDASPYFVSDISATNSPVGVGDTLTVTPNITNYGQQGTQTVALADTGFGDAQRDSVDVTLDTGESNETATLEWATTESDIGEGAITVDTANDSDSEQVAVNEDAYFAVNITDTTSPVSEGDTLTVTANVTNTGDIESTQTVTLTDTDFTASQQASTELTLAGGETAESVTLEWATADGDAGTGELTVASGNDTDTQRVTVDEPATFSVTIDETNESVTAGEAVVVDASIENIGDLTGSQSVEFAVNGTTEASEPISLTPSETTTETFTYATTETDVSVSTVSVASNDDTDERTVTVQEANSAPTAPDDSYTIDEETTLSVAAPGVLANDTDPDGDDLTASVVADPSNGTLALAQNGSIEYTPDADFTGEDSFTYEASDGTLTDTATVSINVTAVAEQSANFSVTTEETNAPVTEGETVSVDATVENVGSATGTQALTLTDFDGSQVDSQSVSLDASETETVTLVWDTRDGDADSGTLTVASANDTATPSVTVDADQEDSPGPAGPGLDTTDPTASATVTPAAVYTNQTITLDGSDSADNRAIERYEWDTDDDGTYELRGSELSHAYESTGRRTVTLRVTDGTGNSATDTATVEVIEDAPPETGETVEFRDVLDVTDEYASDTTESQTVTFGDVLTVVRQFNTGDQSPPDTSGLDATLAVSMPASVEPGETFDATYTLTNDGDDAAKTAGLRLSPSDALTVDSVTGDGTNAPDRFFLQGIDAGDTRTVTYTLRASENLSGGDSIDLEMTGALGTTSESDTATRTIAVVENESRANLTVETIETAPINGTFDVAYRLTNTADRPLNASGLDISLPEDLAVENASGDGIGSPDRFFFGAIDSGEQLVVTYQLAVAADTDPGTRTIAATADLSGPSADVTVQQPTRVHLRENVSVADAVTSPGETVAVDDAKEVIFAYNDGETIAGQTVERADVLEIIYRRTNKEGAQ